jgi:hypothetical protein
VICGAGLRALFKKGCATIHAVKRVGRKSVVREKVHRQRRQAR